MVHTAKMPRESLINNLSRHYKSIAQQVAELAVGGDSKLLLSPDFADLPGFRSFLGESIELEVLPDRCYFQGCYPEFGTVS